MKVIPEPGQFVREAIILIGGAVLAAFVLSRFPALQAYINTNTRGGGGCDCNNPKPPF